MSLDDGASQMSMTGAEFRMFAEMIRKRCGLHFAEDCHYLLERRIARRIRELDLTSYSAYHYQLRSGHSGDAEFRRLVDELTTNETYFFRERSQLRALVTEILPEALVKRRSPGGGPVTIWSAGCSSGEEPYSIVMLAVEAGFTPGVDFRVYAADISGKMLKKARRGVYREASFRETEASLKRKYFTEKQGVWAISDEVKRHVNFMHLNFFEPHKIELLCSMDAIVCRNVIIYFNAQTKREVISRFRDRLRPGGYLLLGHAESLINLSDDFELCHLREELVYRRPLPGSSPRDTWQSAAALAIQDVGSREDDA